MAAYTPNATWNNGAAPGISAEALNHLETQYSAALTMALPLAGGTMTGAINLVASTRFIRDAGSNMVELVNKDADLLLCGQSTQQLMVNAYFDGSNYQRMNTGLDSIRVQLNDEGTVVLYTVSAAANPIAWNGPYKIWNETNDGAASGLDADTTDTYHANNTASNIPVLSAGGALQAPGGVGAKGVWSDVATVVTAGGTFTKNLAMGYAASKARVIAKGRSTGTAYEGANVFCSTTQTDTVSWSYPSYFQDSDTYLSADSAFGTNIKLQDAYISGTNLVLVFKNSDASDQTLKVTQLYWEVD